MSSRRTKPSSCTPASAAVGAPLAVDLDGTLLLSDTLVELMVAGMRVRPLQTVVAFLSVTKGRAALKRAMTDNASLAVEELPARVELLEFLRRERAAGRTICLVTAADQLVADQVAERFDVFDTVHGSNPGLNLKGRRKLAFLKEKFPDGFAYAGDHSADLHVWREAHSIVLAGASASVARRARRLGPPVEAEFKTGGGGSFRAWRKALRVHQWSKNVLMLVPLALGVNATSPRHILLAIAGMLVASVAASATYLINDLFDLSADRRHRSKSSRPLASGRLPLIQGLVAAPLMLIAALIAAFALSPGFAAVLSLYLATTLSYSMWLKRAALVDVVVLASLYTLRIVMGTTLADTAFSPWLLTFSVFFFFSMSLAKRHVEVTSATGDPNVNLPGRGYRPSDAPMTLSFGAASSAAAVLIIVQYMMAEAFPSHMYHYPAVLWAAPALVGLWICRIWLLAQRGELDDDPVAFAVKDRVSIIMGAVMVAAFIVARFWARS